MITSGSYYWRWPESDGSALQKRLKFYNFCLRRTKRGLTKSELPDRPLSHCLAGKLKEFKIFCPQMRWKLLPHSAAHEAAGAGSPAQCSTPAADCRTPTKSPEEESRDGWKRLQSQLLSPPHCSSCGTKHIPWLCTGFLGHGKSGCTVQMLNYASIRTVFPR